MSKMSLKANLSRICINSLRLPTWMTTVSRCLSLNISIDVYTKHVQYMKITQTYVHFNAWLLWLLRGSYVNSAVFPHSCPEFTSEVAVWLLLHSWSITYFRRLSILHIKMDIASMLEWTLYLYVRVVWWTLPLGYWGSRITRSCTHVHDLAPGRWLSICTWFGTRPLTIYVLLFGSYFPNILLVHISFFYDI